MENRNIYLFASGKAVSILGSSIFSFAIGLYVLKLTGSALNYAMTLMLSVIPMVIISPIAGVIADRVSKKWLVSGMDFINSILFAALFILSIYRELTLPVIYIAIVLLNVFTTFFGIGIETAKPALVSSEKLIRINSLSKLIDSSATVLGPVIGGVVYAFVDIRALILFSSIAFMISAVSEWFIDYEFNLERRLYENHEKSEENKSILSDIIEGWKFFSGNRSLLQLFFLFFMLNMLLGFSVNVPLPYIINEVLRFSSSRFGMINSMFPIGLIIGNEMLSEYGKVFEEEYTAALNERLTLFPTAYQNYLRGIETSDTHRGYFSIDKKGRAVDSKKARGSEFSDDISAYDLILKNKERLLSFVEPTRFIFSHSALREGWDNPNVFQICTLKHSDNVTAKRQEVGRGLRLCVNSQGERQDLDTCGESLVHGLNVLTVVASESYSGFVSDLQREIRADLYERPTKVSEGYFTGT